MSDIYVIEGEGKNEKGYDLYSRLLKDRIIFLTGQVRQQMSNSIVAQLLFLAGLDNTKPIHLYINSPGGCCVSGLAIYDTIQYIEPPVYTYCVGMACSMAAVLLAAGSKGHRHALPNSEIMIHQPSGGVSGQTTDILIQVEEYKKCKKVLVDIIAKHTGQKAKKVIEDMERDYFLTSDEAKDYRLIDKIMKGKK